MMQICADPYMYRVCLLKWKGGLFYCSKGLGNTKERVGKRHIPQLLSKTIEQNLQKNPLIYPNKGKSAKKFLKRLEVAS